MYSDQQGMSDLQDNILRIFPHHIRVSQIVVGEGRFGDIFRGNFKQDEQTLEAAFKSLSCVYCFFL